MNWEHPFGVDQPAAGPPLGGAADRTAGDQPAAPTSTAGPRPPVTIQAMPGPGGCLTLVCPTAEIAGKIEAARPALEKLLLDLAGDPEAPAVPPHGPDGWPAGSVEPGEPCPRCDSLETWQDLAGGEHCARCEARRLARGLDLADRAARLRRIARPARVEAGPGGETGPRNGPCGRPATGPDALPVGGKRPSAAVWRPLAGAWK